MYDRDETVKHDMKHPVKHDVKRPTVFAGTTAIQPDGGDTRRFFEYSGGMPSLAVATFCNAMKHNMKHGPDIAPEPNGIRVTHERHVSPWWGASGRQRWFTTHRAECRIRTYRGRRRK